MTDFRVEGADQFLALSKALKRAGQTELRKDLHKNLRKAARPLVPKVKAAARADLPQRGGLAKLVGRAPVRVAVSTGRKAGVRIVVGKRRGSGAAAANKGVIRHPVFGNRAVFVEQRIGNPGWFDDTLEREAPRIALPALEKALDDMADRIVREVR